MSREEPADLIAADWVLRHQRGLSRTEAKDFRAWLEADEAHVVLFAETLETFRRLDRLLEPAARAQPRTSRRFFGRVAPALGALAASVLLLLAAATLLEVPSDAASRAPSAFASGNDARRVDLPDGSVVQLNGHSLIRVSFTRDERRVQLEKGEAFFSVAKDKARPFWVDTPSISVRAVGTEFNVCCQPRAVEIVVTEGAVRILDHSGVRMVPLDSSSPNPSPEGSADYPGREGGPMVAAGSLAKIEIMDVPLKQAGAEVRAEVKIGLIHGPLAWRDKDLEFAAMELAEVVAEFNLYNRHKLIVADPVLARRRFGGTFNSHDYAAFVDALVAQFGVVADHRDNETILRRAGGVR